MWRGVNSLGLRGVGGGCGCGCGVSLGGGCGVGILGRENEEMVEMTCDFIRGWFDRMGLGEVEVTVEVTGGMVMMMMG